ncbi:IPT/TIG domain-containing protein [Pedobacter immunditicola]|uniref:IPT/TIG domain-containing protein n=1 Tax=Pedobacter immunditicola TaxID=3133440 RepID=UPI0030A17666
MKITISHRLLVVVSLFLLIYSCKKKEAEEPTTPIILKPDMQTLSAVVYEDGGVTFNAVINQIPDSLKQFGFIISPDSTFKTSNYFVFATQAITVGEFKMDVFNGIPKDVKYYFTVFVQTPSRIKLFNLKTFESKGNKVMRIDSIFPLRAHLGDTLTIKGKYFSKQSIIVKFDNEHSPTFMLNDSVLKCIVPQTIKRPDPLVFFTNVNSIDTIAKEFKTYKPEISQFTTLATFRDTLEITGAHFSNFAEGNVVTFGNKKARVIANSRSKLSVVVPDETLAGPQVISVTAQGWTTESQAKFNLRPAEVISMPSSGRIFDLITIKGKYFHPNSAYNVLYVNGKAVPFKSSSSSQLSFDIPYIPYPSREGTVSLRIAQQPSIGAGKIKLTNEWVPVTDDVPSNIYRPMGYSFTNNSNYVLGTATYNTTSAQLWKFNAQDLSWTKIDMPFVISNGLMNGNGTKLYFYRESTNDNFWEYDTVSNTWTQLADYPLTARMFGTMFCLGNKVYIGLGTSSPRYHASYAADNSFYEYSRTTNNWKKIIDYPTNYGDAVRNGSSSFVIDNKAYVGCGATSTLTKKFYRYAPKEERWEQIADFPEAAIATIGFAINGLGYIAGGNIHKSHLYQYNPATDSWKNLSDTYVRVYGPEYSFVLMGKDKVYVFDEYSKPMLIEVYKKDLIN